MTAAMTSEALTLVMLMLGFGGAGFAAFSIAERFGQRAASEWWKGKLQKGRGSSERRHRGLALRRGAGLPFPPLGPEAALSHPEPAQEAVRPGSMADRTSQSLSLFAIFLLRSSTHHTGSALEADHHRHWTAA